MRENGIRFCCGIGAFLAPVLLLLLLVHIVREAWPALSRVGLGLLDAGGRWAPLSANPSYSLLPMILGTLYVSALAVVVAVPVGLGCALFLEFYAGRRLRRGVYLLVDLLAGVPSVIFGFVGLTLLVRGLERALSMSAGECVLAAGLLLAVMLLPYVVSACGESVRRARELYGPGAAALGFSKEYALRRIYLPGVGLGILSAVMMSFGRALGETMAVMMVVGNSPILPRLLGRGETIAGLTALEIGSAAYGSLHMSAIYAANLMLLIFLVAILAGVHLLRRRMRRRP